MPHRVIKETLQQTSACQHIHPFGRARELSHFQKCERRRQVKKQEKEGMASMGPRCNLRMDKRLFLESLTSLDLDERLRRVNQYRSMFEGQTTVDDEESNRSESSGHDQTAASAREIIMSHSRPKTTRSTCHLGAAITPAPDSSPTSPTSAPARGRGTGLLQVSRHAGVLHVQHWVSLILY